MSDVRGACPISLVPSAPLLGPLSICGLDRDGELLPANQRAPPSATPRFRAHRGLPAYRFTAPHRPSIPSGACFLLSSSSSSSSGISSGGKTWLNPNCSYAHRAKNSIEPYREILTQASERAIHHSVCNSPCKHLSPRRFLQQALLSDNRGILARQIRRKKQAILWTTHNITGSGPQPLWHPLYRDPRETSPPNQPPQVPLGRRTRAAN